MRTATVLGLLATSAPAWAEPEIPPRYIGASVELSDGLAGKYQPGFELQVSPHEHLELEVGLIHHKIYGNPFADGPAGEDSATWLVQAGARAKYPFRHVAIFAGLGVIGGPNAVSAGCQSSGLIDFCGDQNGTLVYQRWDRALWLRPELGFEAGFAPVVFRITVAPLIQLADPDQVEGCAECDHDEQGSLITLSLHGRIPL